ncbi:F7A19.25 PROTEIN [Salix purpurea]|uniref:F7A19.25 PROTEIN n=1 Tax=Salix purpurea TaxID=77065 RepID=A0A9Q0Z9Z5_SALPP|nr:F7A19.25 PROTEIN [Salix purpurea]
MSLQAHVTLSHSHSLSRTRALHSKHFFFLKSSPQQNKSKKTSTTLSLNLLRYPFKGLLSLFFFLFVLLLIIMAGQRNDHGKRSQHLQSDYGGGKRRNPGDDPSDQHTITNEDTVYRYLCPLRKIGSIIGKGGEIAKAIKSG